MAENTSEAVVQGKKVSVYEVNEYQGKSDAVLGNQYAQVGELVDIWADLVEGYGDKAADFWTAFYESFSQRQIKTVTDSRERLTSTGFYPSSREMTFIRRDPVTIAVFVAKQGADLYVSWRAFIQGKISQLRVAAWLVIVGLASLPFSFDTDVWRGTTEFNSDSFLKTYLIILAITGILIGLNGLFYRKGDILGLLRESLHELQVDELASLSAAVHKSILTAADKVGIDTTKLEPREPFYINRQRKRRI